MKKDYYKGISQFFLSERLLWIIIFLGIVLYSRQYLSNRSLWLDEASVSLDIIKLPVSDFLHQPLSHLQAAPLGFLIIEKLITSFGGTGEYVLRLYPFICGILSIWLFALMARIYLNPKLVFWAIFVFVINPALVYFSSEVKPYYPDILFVLISYVLIVPCCLNPLDWPKTRNMALLGAIIIWFSYPVIFVLLGIGMTLSLASIFQNNRSQLLKMAIILFSWMMSFFICYVLLLHPIVRILGHWGWEGHISFIDLAGWFKVFNNILKYPLGILGLLWLAQLFFCLGLYSFFKENKTNFFLLFSPNLICLLASGFHKYYYEDRFVLFLVPIFLLMIINGIGWVSSKAGKWGVLVAFLSIGILFYGPIISTYRNFISPGKEESRAVISYVKNKIKPGDKLFIYYGAVPAFEYYRAVRGISFDNYVKQKWERNMPSKWIDDLNALHGLKRVWILFSHIGYLSSTGGSDESYFLDYLSHAGGRMVDKYFSPGTSVYLFDLSKFPLTSNPGLIKPNK